MDKTVVKKLRLTIRNRLDIPMKFTVTVQERSICGLYTKDTSEYEFFDGEDITVRKENKWKFHNKANKTLMFLFSMDLVWGNVFDSENLPFEVNYTTNQAQSITLQEIAVTDNISLDLWEKAAFLQFALIFIVLLCVCIGLCSIIAYPVNIIFLIISLVAVGLLIISIIRKFKNVKEEMIAILKK